VSRVLGFQAGCQQAQGGRRAHHPFPKTCQQCGRRWSLAEDAPAAATHPRLTPTPTSRFGRVGATTDSSHRQLTADGRSTDGHRKGKGNQPGRLQQLESLPVTGASTVVEVPNQHGPACARKGPGQLWHTPLVKKLAMVCG
jgi:hypothetical protein